MAEFHPSPSFQPRTFHNPKEADPFPLPPSAAPSPGCAAWLRALPCLPSLPSAVGRGRGVLTLDPALALAVLGGRLRGPPPPGISSQWQGLARSPPPGPLCELSSRLDDLGLDVYAPQPFSAGLASGLALRPRAGRWAEAAPWDPRVGGGVAGRLQGPGCSWPWPLALEVLAMCLADTGCQGKPLPESGSPGSTLFL